MKYINNYLNRYNKTGFNLILNSVTVVVVVVVCMSAP